VFIRPRFQGLLLQISLTNQDAFSRFEYGIKTEETKRKYVRRLELFFNFYKTEGKTIQEKSENFLQITKAKFLEFVSSKSKQLGKTILSSIYRL